MSDTSIEARMAALEGRVAELERQRWNGPPRLGPQPPTREEIAEQSQRFVDAAEAALKKAEAPAVDRSKVCTTSGRPADVVRAEQTNETGQHKDYIVLCPDERAKGFVRPYRDAYRHVGKLQELVSDNSRPSHTVRVGGCGSVTKMGHALSETYARDPKFYSHTFCVGCNRHLPVEEFVWMDDEQPVGS